MGLYGDPTVPWSIVLQADLTEAPDPAAVAARLAALVERYPHLGGAPPVVVDTPADRVRADFAGAGYDGRAPLVRVAVAGATLVLAAHHGAVDGLGLLALLGAAVARPVRTNVVGMRDRPIARSFVLAAARRAVEALVAPPMRLRVRGAREAAGEVAVSARLPRLAVGTAAVTAAAAEVARRWNGRPHGRVIAAVGASRRDGDDLTPEHRAAYLRLRVPPGAGREQVGRLLHGQRLEPDFPPSDNPLLRLGSRALAGRLGATFLVSNLGAVQVGEPVAALAFFPQPSGPAGLAIGVASTAAATTLTLRARSRDFSAEAATELLDRLVVTLQQ